MSTVIEAFIMGRLTKAPELKDGKYGKHCFVDVAVNIPSYAEDGTKADRTLFISAKASAKTAEYITQKNKGDIIAMTCTVKTMPKQEYTRADGKTVIESPVLFAINPGKCDVFDASQKMGDGLISVHIEGRLVKDFAIVGAGDAAYGFDTIAINPRSYVTSDGEKVEPEAQFFNIKANGKAAEILASYGKKGTMLYASDCSMYIREKDGDKDGKPVVYKETVFNLKSGRFRLIAPSTKPKDEAEPGGTSEKATAPNTTETDSTVGQEPANAENWAQALPF